MSAEAIIALLAIIGGTFAFLLRQFQLRSRNFVSHWKKSTRLKPHLVWLKAQLANRSIVEGFYYERAIFRKVKSRLDQNRSLLIKGHSLVGKTRALYEALRNLEQSCDVIIPIKQAFVGKLALPPRFTFWRRGILLLDDIDEYANRDGINELLALFGDPQKYSIVATCRSGPEYYDLLDSQIDLRKTFQVLEFEKLTESETTELIDTVENLPENDKKERDTKATVKRLMAENAGGLRSGYIGSIFMESDKMLKRFNRCDDLQKNILQALKLVHRGGYPRSEGGVPESVVGRVCGGLFASQSESEVTWRRAIEDLEKSELVLAKSNKLDTDVALFDDVVSIKQSDKEAIGLLADLFCREGGVLIALGDKAMEYFKREGNSEFIDEAIRIFLDAIRLLQTEQQKAKESSIKIRLASAYSQYAGVKDAQQNAMVALSLCTELLSFYSETESPEEYAAVKECEYQAHVWWGEMEAKEYHNERARQAWNDASRIRRDRREILLEAPERAELKSSIYSCLTRGYGFLFDMAKRSGHWVDIRSTALAGICLSQVETDANAEWPICIKKWLFEMQVPVDNDDEEGEQASWETELWDTGMALISLRRLGCPIEESGFQAALNWIEGSYIEERGNWNDEIWESAWSILAILYSDTDNKNLRKQAYAATKWIMAFQRPNGEIITPHYTAYFLLVASGMKTRGYIRNEDSKLFEKAIELAGRYLIDAIREKILWAGEGWSNGLILWSLVTSGQFPANRADVIRRVVLWFVQNQDPKTGVWFDVEDTAYVLLGLYNLLRELELADGMGEETVGKLMNEAIRARIDPPRPSRGKQVFELGDDGTLSINVRVPFLNKS